MTYPQFHTVVCGLLQQLGLEVTPDMFSQSSFCTVTIGTTSIELVGIQPGFINLFSFPGTGAKPLSLSAQALALLMAINRYQSAHPAVSISILSGSPAKLMLWSRLPLPEANHETVGNLFARFTDISQVVQAWLKAGAPTGGAKSKSTVAKLQSLNKAPLFNKKETDSDPLHSLPEILLNAHSTRGSSLASIAASQHIRLGSPDGPEQSIEFIQRALNQESGLSAIIKHLKAHSSER